MKTKPIIVVSGEPNSIFYEIFFKSLKKNNFKSPLLLITSAKLFKSQMKKFKFKSEINILKKKNLNTFKIQKNINIIDVNYINFKNSKKNEIETKFYIKQCFDIAFDLLKRKISNKLINGPINKSSFLNKKFLGITEYISYKFNVKKNAMLIYNKELSVCPITTHLPLKFVTKKISKDLIKEKVILINDFYIKNIGFKPKIGVAGLNPHCESIDKFNEDSKIILPTIKFLKKKGYKINGPFPSDTIFLNQNRKKFDVILGMYHDQVLAPIKTIKEYDAINITLGLPFYRVSPDHGPNIKMMNKNLSNPLSLFQALKFLDQK
ncbi:4-hydroxythreonine-4-phosphate dehydrogenase PdxA [Candidatus Pelagibacter sp.]|nr:4-hydroxythreonine-4-phosphate dehydrogenase PdxA [Candidatus Pelagibacter sp.]